MHRRKSLRPALATLTVLAGLAFAPSIAPAATLLGEPTVDRPSQGFDNEWCASEIYAFQGQFVPDGPEVTLNFIAQNWINPTTFRNERIDNVLIVDASVVPTYTYLPNPDLRDAYFCIVEFFNHFHFGQVPAANVHFLDQFDTAPDPRWVLGDASWLDGDTAPRHLQVPVDSTGGCLALADSANPASFINAEITIDRLVPGNLYELFVWSRPGWNQGEDLEVEIYGTEWYSEESAFPTDDTLSTKAVAWADADQDGDHDLFAIESGVLDNRMWRNDGGQLVEVPGALGLRGTPDDRSIAFADADNDGDLDAYLGINGANQLLRNDGGTYADVTSSPLDDSFEAWSVGWTDYDRDGLVDLYVCNANGPNRLLRNLGGLAFSDATPVGLDQSGHTRDAAWGDFDRDGDDDVYLVNESFGNQLFRNDGGGAFVDVTFSYRVGLGNTGVGRSALWEDLDGDLDLDLVFGNRLSRNHVFRNDGTDFLGFELPTASGATVCLTATDFDRDGDLDLFDARLGGANQLLRNDGGMSFVSFPTGVLETTGSARGVAWGDYNGDGDEDAYLATSPASELFQNERGQKRSWLQVDLVGTLSNRSAIGARVEMTDGGVTVVRHVQASGGGTSHSALTVEFAKNALRDGIWDRLEVLWPSGVAQTLLNLDDQQRITVVEPGVVDAPWSSVRPTSLRLAPVAPNPLRGAATIEFALPTPGVPALRIYDATGRLVRDLGGVSRAAGAHRVEWNARDRAGSAVAAGVYFVELRHRGERQVQRIVRSR